MKFSTQWLSRYVDLSGVDIDELGDRITLSVAELEGIHRFGEGLESILVARIETCERHPDADRLSVCQVNDGSGTLRTVVCGAPNAQAGLLTALAPPGTQVGEIHVKAASIRGVESAGMLCSPKELGLTDDHAGICSFEEDWAPGTPLHTVLPLIDAVLEIDNKSLTHRPDLWGHVGMAREVSGLLKRPLNLPATDIELGTGAPLEIDVQDAERCPRYCALRMSGIEVKPAPLWMQSLLHRCDVRAINNVVDVTNFVMFELGNPMHAFDMRQISGGKIEVALATEGEEVVTLDDQERVLSATDLVIRDGTRPVAIAGVMGLANSEVQSDTTELLLEAANFRADGVRRSAVRLGLRTDSSARFEKALDPALAPTTALRFATLMNEILPSAKVTSDLGDACFSEGQTPTIETSVSYINRRLGTSLSVKEVHGYLTSVEFEIDDLDGDKMAVKVPSFRATKDISIPEDLVEEVGRLHGFDNITPIQPSVEIPKPYRHSDRTLHRRIRTIMSLGLGRHEVRSYSFDFEPFLERIGRGPYDRIGVKNPISVDQTHLRPRLLPSLLHALERSMSYSRSLNLYDIGRIFRTGEAGDELPPQPYHLASLVWKHPSDAEGDEREQAVQAYADMKGTLESLFDALGISLRFKRADKELSPWLHPVRSASICTEAGAVIGYVGTLHPDVTDALDCGAFIAAAELDVDALNALGFDDTLYETVAKYPAVPYDLSIIVPESVSHSDLHERILSAHEGWVKSADCTAVYRGDPIPEGEKSMTYRIVFQSDEATLEMDAVNEVVNGLVDRLGSELGGWLRT